MKGLGLALLGVVASAGACIGIGIQFKFQGIVANIFFAWFLASFIMFTIRVFKLWK